LGVDFFTRFPWVLDQIGQEIEHLGLYGDRVGTTPQLVPIRIESEIFK
jgi:hypothetical protein